MWSEEDGIAGTTAGKATIPPQCRGARCSACGRVLALDLMRFTLLTEAESCVNGIDSCGWWQRDGEVSEPCCVLLLLQASVFGAFADCTCAGEDALLM